MKYQEIINKSVSELYDGLYDLKKQSLSIRVQRATGSAPDTSQIRKIRRSAARIKTRLVQLTKKK